MLFGHQDNAHPPVASAATAPQGQGVDDEIPINPLAVDPQTGASLPVVPENSPGPIDTPEEQSVLNQGPSVPADNATSASLDAPSDSSAAAPDPSAPFSATAPEDTPEPEQHHAPAQPQAQHDDVSEQPADVPAPAADALDQVSEAHVDTTPEPKPAPEPKHEQPQPQAQHDDVSEQPADVPAPAADALDQVSEAHVDTTPAPDSNALLDLKQQAIAELSPLVAQLDQMPEERFRTTMMLIQSTDNSALLQDAYAAAQAIPDEKARAQALLDIVNEINYFTQQLNSQ